MEDSATTKRHPLTGSFLDDRDPRAEDIR